MFHSYRDVKRVPQNNITGKAYPIDKYSCEFCAEGWESETEVVFHKKLHSDAVGELIGEDKPVCWTCIKTFKSKEDLFKHIRTIHLLSSDEAVRVEREIFICDYCDSVFFNKLMLIYHIASNHKLKTKSSSLQCPKCLKVNTIPNLRAHFYSHLMYSVLACPICYLKCRNWDHYTTHLSDAHQKYCYCTICAYTASSLETFKKHCQTHRKSSSNVLIIKGKHYINSFFVPNANTGWKYRKYLPHKGLRLQKELRICILCREICENKRAMVSHLMQHTQIDMPVPQKAVFICKCGQQFNYKILLKQHQTQCKKDSESNDNQTYDARPIMEFADSNDNQTYDARAITESADLPLPFDLGPGITLTPIMNTNIPKQTFNDKVDKNYKNTGELSDQVEIIQLNSKKILNISTSLPDLKDDNYVVLQVDGGDEIVPSTSDV